MAEDVKDAVSAIPGAGETKAVQATIVKFSLDNQPIEVNLDDVNKLFIDIDKYNSQFSMGAIMARHLFSGTTSVVEEEGDQQANAFFLTAAHKNLLNSTGLSLEPVSGNELTIEGESAKEVEMRVKVKHRSRFTTFLGALEPEHVTPELKNNLEGLSTMLSMQILDYNHNLSVPKDEILELFGSLEKIITEYKRLGMGKAVGKLETYLTHGRVGDLKEFIEIEKDNLLEKPELRSGGPATWHMDTTPQGLERRWNKAIEILRTIKRNPKAVDLSQQLEKNLTGILRMALVEVNLGEYKLSSGRTYRYRPEDKRDFQKVLETANQKLNELARS